MPSRSSRSHDATCDLCRTFVPQHWRCKCSQLCCAFQVPSAFLRPKYFPLLFRCCTSWPDSAVHQVCLIGCWLLPIAYSPLPIETDSLRSRLVVWMFDCC